MSDRRPPLSPEARTALVTALKAGNTRTDAALYAGIDPDELRDRMRHSPTIRRDVLQAEAADQVANTAAIAKAARSGDWRAAQYLLERSQDDRRCPGTNRQGERCGNAAGKGTDHVGVAECANHGGATPAGRKHAKEIVERRILAEFGQAVETDPHVALMGLVWEAQGNVAFLRSRIRQLDDLVGPDHTGDGAPHALVKLYNEERDRLAKVSQAAISAGIAERAMAIVEQQADAIVTVVLRALDALALTPEQRDQAQAAASVALREFEGFEIVATGQPRVRA